MSDQQDPLDAFVCFEHNEFFLEKDDAKEHFMDEHGMSEEEVLESFEDLTSVWED